MKNKLSAFLTTALLFSSVLAVPAFAHHQQEVLGDSTITTTPTLPATSDGPGLILPDSPFYFLDTLKQNIRLFLAFTPEQKATVNADVAGERLAEVRFELAKGNIDAAQVALEGVADHLKQASDEVAQAQLQGRDVTSLAQDLNENIKQKRADLTLLEDTSSGELKARVGVIQQSLLESKVTVEDALPDDQLQKEVDENITSQVEQEVDDASHSAEGLQRAIDVLERNASDAAEKNQTKREEALRKAIAEKNTLLQQQQQKALDDDKKAAEVEQESINAARDAAKKAQEAAVKFQIVKQQTDSLQHETTSGSSTQSNSGGGTSLQSSPTPQPSSGSGSTGDSSSGSNSGSGSSGGSHSGDDH